MRTLNREDIESQSFSDCDDPQVMAQARQSIEDFFTAQPDEGEGDEDGEEDLRCY